MSKRMTMNRTIMILSLALVVGLVGPARADLVFNLTITFGEGDTPAGTAPWLRATFAQDGENTVTLTLDSLLQDPDEFVDGSFGWGFNFDPVLEPTFSEDNIVQVGDSGDPSASITVDANNLQADGDGKYDFAIQFPLSGDRFGQGDTAVFTISHTGITPGSFNYYSDSGGGQGSYLSAAEVQGIGPDAQGSGWIAVPAPGAALLGVIGLGLVGWIRRRMS